MTPDYVTLGADAFRAALRKAVGERGIVNEDVVADLLRGSLSVALVNLDLISDRMANRAMSQIALELLDMVARRENRATQG